MSRMFKRLIREAVNQEIEARLSAIPKPVSPPQGYNPLEVIRGGMYHWVYSPCNDINVWVNLRTSNSTQLEACGAMSLIEDIKNNHEPTEEEMLDRRNTMEEICKITMNNPTFDEFVQMTTDTDIVHSKMRLELERIKAIDCTGMSATEKDVIDTEVREKELHLAFLLPENLFDFIVRWALGVDVSDVKKLTDEQLLTAGLRAESNKNAPHENISGVFTDRDAGDIDDACHLRALRFHEDQRIAKGIR
jgi:hypothetical protein